jgi:hypothetical protein
MSTGRRGGAADLDDLGLSVLVDVGDHRQAIELRRADARAQAAVRVGDAAAAGPAIVVEIVERHGVSLGADAVGAECYLCVPEESHAEPSHALCPVPPLHP